MNPLVRFTSLLAVVLAAAVPAAAAEYVVGSGVAFPDGERPETVSMAGMRHVLAGGLFGEASVMRVPSAPGGTMLATLAYARPWRAVRTGAGVLALRAHDRNSPAGAAPLHTAGFQFAAGIQVPLSSGLGVDLDARYVFFDRPEGQSAPDRFATRYWTLTLGLAFLGDAPKDDRR